MYWYVLFVMTGYEHKTVKEISRTWLKEGLTPFVPMYDARFRRAGKVILEKRRLIPGYVFLESPMRGLDFYLSVRPLISRSEYALKLLRHGTGNLNHNFEMNEAEGSFLQKIFNHEYCVEMSKGIIEGTTVKVTSGPLEGHEGLITKVNRHKMQAEITMAFMNASRKFKVGLEVVEKIL